MYASLPVAREANLALESHVLLGEPTADARAFRAAGIASTGIRISK
jgi:hypothetical protein